MCVPIVLKSGSLNFLEPYGPVQACNGIALPKKCLCFTKNFHDLPAFWGYFVFLFLQFCKSLEANKCFISSRLWCLWWFLLVVVSCEHKHYCTSTDHWWNDDVTSYLVCNCVEITVCAIFLHCLCLFSRYGGFWKWWRTFAPHGNVSGQIWTTRNEGFDVLTSCMKWINICVIILKRGPGSSVGIVTDYGLDSLGIESRWGQDFPPVQTNPGAHPASCKMGTGSFPGGKSAAGACCWPLTPF